MPVEAYSPEWEEQEYQRLAPQIQELVNRMFANRGARFGAKDEILAKRLAALKAEISMDASKKKVDLGERRRMEDRSERMSREQRSFLQGEQLRREGEARNERTRQEMIEERRIRDYQDAQAKAKRSELMRYFYDSEAPDRGMSRFMDFEAYEKGEIPKPQDDPYEDVRRRKQASLANEGPAYGPTLPADREIRGQITSNPTVRNRGFYPSYTSNMTSDYSSMRGDGDGGGSSRFLDSYKPQQRFPMSGDPTFKKVGGPGDITPDTPYQFKKIRRDAQDVFGGLKSGFRDVTSAFRGFL